MELWFGIGKINWNSGDKYDYSNLFYYENLYDKLKLNVRSRILYLFHIDQTGQKGTITQNVEYQTGAEPELNGLFNKRRLY